MAILRGMEHGGFGSELGRISQGSAFVGAFAFISRAEKLAAEIPEVTIPEVGFSALNRRFPRSRRAKSSVSPGSNPAC
jgi:hypothetical protein